MYVGAKEAELTIFTFFHFKNRKTRSSNYSDSGVLELSPLSTKLPVLSTRVLWSTLGTDKNQIDTDKNILKIIHNVTLSREIPVVFRVAKTL